MRKLLTLYILFSFLPGKIWNLGHTKKNPVSVPDALQINISREFEEFTKDVISENILMKLWGYGNCIDTFNIFFTK